MDALFFKLTGNKILIFIKHIIFIAVFNTCVAWEYHLAFHILHKFIYVHEFYESMWYTARN